MKQKVVTISAQISAELEKALNMVCDLEERSKSYLIKKWFAHAHKNYIS